MRKKRRYLIIIFTLVLIVVSFSGCTNDQNSQSVVSSTQQNQDATDSEGEGRKLLSIFLTIQKVSYCAIFISWYIEN